MFLHNAIAAALARLPRRSAHRSAIAAAVARLGLYQTRSGRPASANQVSARVSKHPELFRLLGAGVIELR
jgi:hypothetical protein